MKAQLSIYESTKIVGAGVVEGGVYIDNAAHLEFIVRAFLLSCDCGLQASLKFWEGGVPNDDRIKQYRWKQYDVFLSPSWRAVCEETEKREQEEL